ncbi:39S ribosomal protein L42, mitochondrial-like [Dreissena polymorpha]|uniref:Large ribosomal subunit protein mL42 n=1 Tax=Dreissena polymorpha TaxID=45954 RepID=A0A9D4H9B9_DREPO|nr:39S ribosomal protein L42, mitochondrial-like [Dreissena polymorpha]XP_052286047.1 39S ribosomal protein L42, mitochondrial-like [Dreissena polymorpha]KAH3829273.1 hypothetical protein DPMN_131268 [Dreissena polymorpha]KAH3829289.1 hypothetical protein DPMN_131284 [Dreissena polymorpha]
MAAPMNVAWKKCLLLCSYSRYCQSRLISIKKKTEETSSGKDPEQHHERNPLVGMSADGQTLVCWHPEPEHPYDHTRGMEYAVHELEEGTSILKDEVIRRFETRYKPKGPNIQELSNITYTTKHQWFPRPAKKFRKLNPPKDRDSL